MKLRIAPLAAALALVAFLPDARSATPADPFGRAAYRLLRNWHDGPPDKTDPTTGIPTSSKQFVDAIEGTSIGSPATAELIFSVQPTDADTLTIGADVYEFALVATNNVLANTTNIGVEIGTDVAATKVNLIYAINARDPNCRSATLVDSAGAAAKACGTEHVFADAITSRVRIASATAAGGDVIAANPSISLNEGITSATDIWAVSTSGVAVNMNTLGGRAAAPYATSIKCVTITAPMITNTYNFRFPFVMTSSSPFIVQVRDSAGKMRMDGDLGSDTFVYSNGGVLATFSGGAAPDVQATDAVCITAAP